MATMKPPRYVVLVWFYDHWSVNAQTDDKAEAERVKTAAENHIDHGGVLLIDTQEA